MYSMASRRAGFGPGFLFLAWLFPGFALLCFSFLASSMYMTEGGGDNQESRVRSRNYLASLLYCWTALIPSTIYLLLYFTDN
jgi:hypothetical protein